jgi:N-acetylneuraminate epimerase
MGWWEKSENMRCTAHPRQGHSPALGSRRANHAAGKGDEKEPHSASLCYTRDGYRTLTAPTTPPMKLRTAALLLLTSHACAGGPVHWHALAPLPDPLGVAGPFAGGTGGGLLVAGGANFPAGMPWTGGAKAWTDRIWFLEKKDAAWKEGGKLPRPLAYGVSVTHRGKVWCVGGSDSARHHPDVFSLEWRDGSPACAAATPLPAPLANAAGAVDQNGTLYVVCGSESPGAATASNRFYSASLEDSELQWNELPPLPAEGRIFPMAASQAGVFYVFGGAALEPADGKPVRRYLRDCWSYSSARGWRRLADLPVPAAAAASPAPFVNGCLWVLGGDDGALVSFEPLSEHPGFPGRAYGYDPTADRWRSGENVPAPRATLPCVPWDGEYVLPSGEVRPGVRSNQVWSLKE